MKPTDGRIAANKKKANFVYVHGELITVKEAYQKYGLTHYMIQRCLVTEERGIKGYPSKEEAIAREIDAIYRRHPNAPSLQVLQDSKDKRISAKTIAEQCGVKRNVVLTLMHFYGIPTNHDQVDPKVHEELTVEVLKTYLEKNYPAIYIANKFGVSEAFIFLKIKEYGLSTSEKAVSSGEIELKEFIEGIGFTVEKRHHRTYGYEIDIYIPALHLGFEFNGIFWHGEGLLNKRKSDYHQEKYLRAKQDGIRLIQIWDVDWYNRKDLIKRKISHLCGVNSDPTVGARSCTIQKNTGSDVQDFYNSNHIQGYKRASHHYTLQYHNQIVAALSITKDKIERYATSVHVPGGFSRLLKYAITDLQLKYIQTFADLFWSDHEDNQYEKNGFSFVHLTRPNYYWCKGAKKFSRLKFQKHKLSSMPNYSLEKSERQIMQENGYYRVFDAGHAKFERYIP